MLLTRRWSVFLILAGAFNWFVWPRFSLAIWHDARAWHGAFGHSAPTSFLWVHAVLIITALAVGTVVGVLGVRGLRGRHSDGKTPQAGEPNDSPVRAV